MKDITKMNVFVGDLSPTLFSSAKDLLSHIARNNLHKDGARIIPLCTYATPDLFSEIDIDPNELFTKNSRMICNNHDIVNQEFVNA